MTLRILFSGTVAKHTDAPSDNEDSFHIALDAGKIAMADGASESFDAKNWAKLLVEQVIHTGISDDLLCACSQEYEALHDPNTLSWSKAAAYERGSFSTLLAVEENPNQKSIDVTAIGDSLAVWSDGRHILDSAPYSYSIQFDEKPILLSTRLEINPSLDGEAVRRVTWNYESEPRYLLCMTDALGAWFLSKVEAGDTTAFQQLCNLPDGETFLQLIESERNAGHMRRDDATLVVALLT